MAGHTKKNYGKNSTKSTPYQLVSQNEIEQNVFLQYIHHTTLVPIQRRQKQKQHYKQSHTIYTFQPISIYTKSYQLNFS